MTHSSVPSRFKRFQNFQPIDRTRVTEVKDRLGNLVYRRGEKTVEKVARELEQWTKKMRCSGTTGQRLESFKDIKVGVLEDDVLYKSPTLEPFPDLTKEKFTFKGGKDRNGKLKGRGQIEFENGDLITGVFDNSIRHGECRVETFRNGLRVIIGTYVKDKLSGKAKVIYDDDTWLEGYFKEGVLHGFVRRFDGKGRLTFVGIYRNGKPHGVCWRVIRGGGAVVGRVDEKGELSGIRVAYIYPDFQTALVGNYSNGILDFAQVAHLKAVIDDKGIKIPLFTEPNGRLYKREIATYDHVTSDPHLQDPYESKMVEIRSSRVPFAGTGLFCRVKVEPNTVLAFYNGKRLRPRGEDWADHHDWAMNAYKIYDPSVKNQTIDIPKLFRDEENYTASLAHKTNHSFMPNAELVVFDHPRFGVIPCVTATHDIEAGEEVFVHYGYNLSNCPDWYEQAWLSGSYPIPDSMRDCWGGKGNSDSPDGDSGNGSGEENASEGGNSNAEPKTK